MTTPPAPLLQLVNSGGDARGRRYSDDDRAAAYRRWVSIDRQSFTKTSDALGVSENTLRSWADTDGWKARANAETDAAAELGRVAVMAKVITEYDRSIETLVALRDDAAQPGKVRVDCALALLAIGGVSTKSTTVATKDPAPPKPAIPTGRLTDADRERMADKMAGRVAGGPVPAPDAAAG